jgi:uroporphyrinogen-III synthase
MWGKALTSPDRRPLAGRRIVVTRAPEQSAELLDCLREAGADALSLPMVRFLEPVDTAALDQAIAALEEFDWLVLTSANAVQFFLARCRKLDRWLRGEKPKIAVVGPATRASLEAAGLRAAFVPQTFNSAALVDELAPYLPGRRVLLPRSDLANYELPAEFGGAGAEVTEVVAYRTVAPERLDDAMIGMICNGEVDAVIFFSPSAVQQFAGALGSRPLARIGERVALAAVGSVTAEAIRAAGAVATVQAPEATAASVVAALARHFAPLGAAKGRF